MKELSQELLWIEAKDIWYVLIFFFSLLKVCIILFLFYNLQLYVI